MIACASPAITGSSHWKGSLPDLGSRLEGQFLDRGADGEVNALAPGSKTPQTKRFRLIC